PETDPADFAVATLEHYVARDGTEIPMFVRRPPGCDDGGERAVSCPVVVSFHGGPEAQAGPGFHPFSQLLVDAGMIVVHPNVRGSNGYGKTWINADNGAKRLEVITDIEDAATFIRNNWAVDGVPPRIGVYGGSYGGYSALLGMTRFAGAYDAGVSVVGMSSLLTFLENTAPYRRKIRSVEYGDPEADRDALVELSPITWIDRLAAPLLLIQGANDPRVPVGEAVQIHEAAQAKGIDSGLIVFPDEGHGVVKRANQVLQYGHVIEFFTRHLGVRG
ncbi:MAG: alpha/beta hydrolase family protein, partial [Acidimicrobiia bacterium]